MKTKKKAAAYPVAPMGFAAALMPYPEYTSLKEANKEIYRLRLLLLQLKKPKRRKGRPREPRRTKSVAPPKKSGAPVRFTRERMKKELQEMDSLKLLLIKEAGKNVTDNTALKYLAKKLPLFERGEFIKKKGRIIRYFREETRILQKSRKLK